MLASYQAERYSAQSLLWDCCCLGFAVIRRTAGVVGRAPRLVSHFTYILWAMAMLTWPDVMALGRGALVALAWCAGLATVLGLVVFVLANPLIIVAAGIIAAFAYVTYPRSKAVRK
ncbi:MAG: hypothetical protein E6R03_02645 [Hyphomicrobiaceae bacterium]|nr:MAG: hypothetical protein E6R03_02645 [Hyphomicrobiaceae bacterium]